LKVKEILLSKIKVTKRAREIDNVYGGLNLLVQSIKEYGLLNPITVSIIEDSERENFDYLLLAGERRFRAFERLGREKIPAHILGSVRDKLDYTILEYIENAHREDLSWMEKISTIKKIKELQEENYNWTTKNTAELLQISPETVRKQVRLATLIQQEPALKEVILKKNLTYSEALDYAIDFSSRKGEVRPKFNLSDVHFYSKTERPTVDSTFLYSHLYTNKSFTKADTYLKICSFVCFPYSLNTITDLIEGFKTSPTLYDSKQGTLLVLTRASEKVPKKGTFSDPPKIIRGTKNRDEIFFNPKVLKSLIERYSEVYDFITISDTLSLQSASYILKLNRRLLVKSTGHLTPKEYLSKLEEHFYAQFSTTRRIEEC
jgi:ParB/RepB/Spo0J family partition protein